MMRDFYFLKPKYSCITQGSIITGCVANGFESCKVWGCIITARCDIEQRKVDRIHYLPIVSLDDWLQSILVKRLREAWCNALKSSLKNQLKNNSISVDFLDRGLSRYDFEQLIRSTFKSKEAEGFLSDYDKWLSSNNVSVTDILSTKLGMGLLKHEIDKVIAHESSSDYLMEGWDSDDFSDYKVLLLREIKTISKSCAYELADGIIESDLQESFFNENELAKTNDQSGFYYVDCEIQSPYIEHIIQRFTTNFSRIGVIDLPKSTVSQQLIDYSKTLLL